MIVCNGRLLAFGAQFSVGDDVQVVTANVDLEQVRAHRARSVSRGLQSELLAGRIGDQGGYFRVRIPFSLSEDVLHDPRGHGASKPVEMPFYTVEEEISFGPACWLWDYLRRSRAPGFFLPLSG